MTKHWCWAACLILTLVYLVARAEVARCQEDTEQGIETEQVIEKVCGHIPPENKMRRLECRAVVTMTMNKYSEDSLKKGLKMLEQAQAMAPNDLSVLNNIALCHAKKKNYKSALTLFEKSLRQKPDNLGVKFYTCLLKERLGYPRSEYRTCYHSVVQALKEQKMTEGIDYVFMVLIAEEPDAQAIKNKYIASLDPKGEFTEHDKKSLGNFNRDEHLHKLLP